MPRLLFIILVLISFNYGQVEPFKVGEKLTYSLKFNVLSVGKGYLSVEPSESIRGVPTHHLRFEAKTSGLADRIFRIRDKIDIWANKQDLTLLKITKKIREGKYHRNFNTEIDYTKSIAVTNNNSIKIDGLVRDPYSLLYYLRTVPLEIGQIMDFTTFDQNKITNFQIIVEDKETVETPIGNFPCLVVTPFREGKSLLKDEGDMQIWFSDNEFRMPVQIKIKLNYGTMTLKLRKVNL